jgi:hypothetical protein
VGRRGSHTGQGKGDKNNMCRKGEQYDKYSQKIVELIERETKRILEENHREAEIRTNKDARNQTNHTTEKA